MKTQHQTISQRINNKFNRHAILYVPTGYIEKCPEKELSEIFKIAKNSDCIFFDKDLTCAELIANYCKSIHPYLKCGTGAVRQAEILHNDGTLSYSQTQSLHHKHCLLFELSVQNSRRCSKGCVEIQECICPFQNDNKHRSGADTEDRRRPLDNTQGRPFDIEYITSHKKDKSMPLPGCQKFLRHLFLECHS